MKIEAAAHTQEHLDRLRAMVEDHGETWDLSPNDQAAIKFVLAELGRVCVANAAPRQGDEADLLWMEGLVRRGCELVESAICHVSHGGPTIAEAKAWLDQANIWLKERRNSDGK